ncbi:bile acid:sodium symporter [Halobacillus shinanisalinarum]|uniref:Bile acid:sodium symporter n=1 Tax=Halobacillus shinanisalinarum TaxID=2932258 RepID=A0ABY4H3Q9_9BACI|nr:bile acid:sodium symporter [Halobacillus shinanisalinarum]UOQ94803.1 bile acid:sodium symporter [Halobacillus shinanisalinarum]
MFTREKLENNQVWLYIGMLIMATIFGFLMPGYAENLGSVISMIIALLMYSMFSQIPFTSLKKVFGDPKYFKALLTINFIIVPIVVWLLAQFLPGNPTLLIGFYLVLLTPCIDYVIVFTSLGKGDEKLVLTSTPILFVAQMLLLPLYLWMFMGRDAVGIVEPTPFFEAFFGLIIIPLVVALLLQIVAKRGAFGKKILDGSAWLPVPFMALTLFIVVASQIIKLPTYVDQIIKVIPLYIVFMVIMPFIAKYVAKWFKLGMKSGRALIFSGSTRNSLVVLPLALALPEIGNVVAAVIITQTIIELISELVYIRVVPNFLLRDK